MNQHVDPIFQEILRAIGGPMNAPCRVEAELSAHETAQHILDKTPLDLPDFSQLEDLQQAGIDKEYRPALAQIMEIYSMGPHADRDELLKACAKLERAMLHVWKDNA